MKIYSSVPTFSIKPQSLSFYRNHKIDDGDVDKSVASKCNFAPESNSFAIIPSHSRRSMWAKCR